MVSTNLNIIWLKLTLALSQHSAQFRVAGFHVRELKLKLGHLFFEQDYFFISFLKNILELG